MLTMLSFAISIIVSLGIALSLPTAVILCRKKKKTSNTKTKTSSTIQNLSAVTAASASTPELENSAPALEKTQSLSAKPKPKARIPAIKPLPEKAKANSVSNKSNKVKSKRKEVMQLSNEKSTEREEKVDAGDSEQQEVVPEHLVKVMGDLDNVVDRAELEKEIEAMKSVHELEDESPQGKKAARDVQIAQDNCKLYQTNTTAYNKEKEKKKTELAAKKEGKPVDASPPKMEDSSLSYRPNF